MKEEFITCSCSDKNHLLCITKFDDDEELYLSVVLNNRHGFFKRILIALKYIFRIPTTFGGHWVEFVLHNKGKEQLKEFLNE